MRRAARLDGVGASPIRRMHEGAPADAIPLGLGEPTWPMPPEARAALASGAGPCPYGPNRGLPELVGALSDFYGTGRDRVMTAAGSQAALFALFQAWADPGDEILVPDPGFVAYPILAALAGAEARPYALAPDGSLDPAAFGAALDAAPRAAIAVVNHPSNPTGGGATVDALASVAAACERRGVLLVSDEVYRELHFGPKPPSLADASPYGVVVSSLSKGWGSPGLRVGWAIGDPSVLEPARLVHAYMNTAPARPCQEAAAALLARSDRILADARAELARRWEALADALRAEFGLDASPPAGGFYHWLALPDAGLGDPLGFCLRLRDEAGVIVIPGAAFGERGRRHARLSFASEPDRIREGVRRLAAHWRNS